MDIEKIYQQTLEYLYTFVDYSLTKGFRDMQGKWDLGRMRAFMQRLGDPQQSFPTIHVAGTKGKGSVAALCASAIQSCGYTVGLYTSPHLEDYSERIRVNGQNISHAELVALVEELKPAIEATPEITTFEITTALAFLYFARRGVDAAVIEVGLGGRLDATNILLPVVSVITSISYDHTAILGDSLAQIAAEKAGILKPGIPLVLAPQPDEARVKIEQIAAERGLPLIQVGSDWRFAALDHSLDGQNLVVWHAAQPGVRQELRIALLGEHQVKNAAVAYAALEVFNQRGLPLELAGVQHGFQNVVWPARFDILRREPLLLVDSAHNRESARLLVKAFDDYFPGQEIVLIFGASEDKDIAGMFAELLPHVSLVIFTKSFHPRAAEPAALVAMAAPYGVPTQVVMEVEEALAAALSSAGANRAVLAAGSVFVAAGVRQAWYSFYEIARGTNA